MLRIINYRNLLCLGKSIIIIDYGCVFVFFVRIFLCMAFMLFVFFAVQATKFSDFVVVKVTNQTQTIEWEEGRSITYLQVFRIFALAIGTAHVRFSVVADSDCDNHILRR